MMKRILVFFLLGAVARLFSGDGVVLKEIYNPNKIEMYNGKLYVAQGTEFYIYSLMDLSLVKRFGRNGEGPGELLPNPYVFNDISQSEGNIVVMGEKKIIWFTENGEFVREAPKNRQYFKMVPFGNGFIVNSLLDKSRDQNILFSKISLVDGEGKLLKELFEQRSELGTARSDGVQALPMFADTPHFVVSQNRLYVENSIDGLKIEVFDNEGNRVNIIDSVVEPLPVTEQNRDRTLAAIRSDRSISAAVKESGGWDNFTKRYKFKFPDFFPICSDFVMDKDRIYLQTYEVREGETAYLVMGQNSGPLKKIFLPSMADTPFTAILVGQEVRLYKIYDSVFYYLKENAEEETWSFCSVHL